MCDKIFQKSICEKRDFFWKGREKRFNQSTFDKTYFTFNDVFVMF